MKHILAWLPVASILLGTYMVTHNVFDFSYERGCGLTLDRFAQDCANPVAYFYTEGGANGIGVGSVLIVAGAMALRKKMKS